MTDSFSKKKTSFCLSLILTHKDSFCIVLFCFLVQCRENTLNALDLLPLTHKKTKTNRPLLRDRQGMVMTRPRSSLLVSFAVNKNNACQFSCMTSTLIFMLTLCSQGSRRNTTPSKIHFYPWNMPSNVPRRVTIFTKGHRTGGKVWSSLQPLATLISYLQ